MLGGEARFTALSPSRTPADCCRVGRRGVDNFRPIEQHHVVVGDQARDAAQLIGRIPAVFGIQGVTSIS